MTAQAAPRVRAPHHDVVQAQAVEAMTYQILGDGAEGGMPPNASPDAMTPLATLRPSMAVPAAMLGERNEHPPSTHP
jgi:hypothetical protein